MGVALHSHRPHTWRRIEESGEGRRLWRLRWVCRFEKRRKPRQFGGGGVQVLERTDGSGSWFHVHRLRLHERKEIVDLVPRQLRSIVMLDDGAGRGIFATHSRAPALKLLNGLAHGLRLRWLGGAGKLPIGYFLLDGVSSVSRDRWVLFAGFAGLAIGIVFFDWT